MRKFPVNLLRASVVIATMQLAGGQLALAQSSPAKAEQGVIEEVFITGSRIVRKDYSSSSPVATIEQEQMTGFGAVTAEEALNAMPQFIAGNSSSTIAIGGGGGATLNLRALGPTRNLVLMDQRRLPTSTPFGEVDVNIVPGIILKSVEVLSGGASSVYGSEAISGVVNFQSADYFDGVRYNIEAGTSGESDGAKTDLSVLFGSESSDGRGRTMVALARSDREEVRGWDRSWRLNAVRSSFIGQGAYRDDATNPIDVDALNDLFASYGTPGAITSGDRLGFNDDGTLFTQGFSNEFLNYSGPSGKDTLFEIGSGGLRQPVARQGDIVKPLERKNIFAKGEYDINDHVTAYAQALYSDVETKGTVSRNLTLFAPEGAQVSVPVTNPFIPQDLQNLLATRDDPDADFGISKRFLSLPDRTHVESYETTQLVFGIKGDLGYKDWTYDFYTTKDGVSSTETIPDLALSSRVEDLLFASDGGASICEGGYNPFGLANELSLSAECQNYIAPGSVSKLETDRSLWEGTITGSLFEVPAGEVMFSFTTSYREDELNTQTDISISSNDAFGLPPTVSTSGKTETTEYGGELLIPLTESIDMTAGYRVSDQDVTGKADSWSVGLEWSATDSLFVRGSLQQAVRAPNVGELFNAPLGSEVTVGDPLAGGAGDPCDSRNSPSDGTLGICAAQGADPAALTNFQHDTTSLPLVISGNQDLDAEIADTFTIGVVWQPDLGKHDLSLTLDYWQIEVEDVINPIEGSEVLDRCYNTAQNPGSDPNNQFCQLISRDKTGSVREVRSKYLNLAALETSGVDLQINHSVDIGPGILSNYAFFGFLTKYDTQAFPGERFVDESGTVNGTANRASDNNFHPELKFTIAPTYTWDDYSVGLRWRYTDAVDDLTGSNEDIDDYSLFDLTASYHYSEQVTLKLSVSNLTDEEPPEYGGEDQTRWGSYDVIGRYFSVGISGSF